MKNMIKTELKKAIFSKYFLFGLALVMLFTVLSGVYMIECNGQYNPEGAIDYAMENGKWRTNPDLHLFSFYNSWVGGEQMSLAQTLFFILLPVGAALPFAWSFYTERKCGYLKNIACRTNKEHYYYAKIIAVFVTGVIVVFLALVVNVMLVSAFMPMIDPYVGYNFYNHLYFGNMWVDLFYTHPFVYTILYMLLESMYGGIFALLSFVVTFYINNLFAVLFTPFLSMLAFGYIEGLIYGKYYDLNMVEFVATKFIHSRTGTGQTIWWAVLIVTVVLLGFSLLTIIIRGKKDEVF